MKNVFHFSLFKAIHVHYGLYICLQSEECSIDNINMQYFYSLWGTF